MLTFLLSRVALELLLNVNQNEGIPFVTSSAGVAISVRSSTDNSEHFNIDGSIFLPTGFEASVALKKVGLCRVTD